MIQCTRAMNIKLIFIIMELIHYQNKENKVNRSILCFNVRFNRMVNFPLIKSFCNNEGYNYILMEQVVLLKQEKVANH